MGYEIRASTKADCSKLMAHSQYISNRSVAVVQFSAVLKFNIGEFK